MALFLRRGLSAGDADDLAERLVLRDRDGTDLRLCLECRNLAGHASNGWRCQVPRRAGVSASLPRDLVAFPQRCPAFQENPT